MVFRLTDSVSSGFIDNTEKGRVYGELMIDGIESPLTFDLEGDCFSDIAGSRIEFTRRNKIYYGDNIVDIPLVVKGKVGEITASKQFKEYEMIMSHYHDWKVHSRKPFHHIRTCYFEWYSENARFIILLADYNIKLVEQKWMYEIKNDKELKKLAAENLEWYGRKFEEIRHSMFDVIYDLNYHKADEYEWGLIMTYEDFMHRKYKETTSTPFEKSFTVRGLLNEAQYRVRSRRDTIIPRLEQCLDEFEPDVWLLDKIEKIRNEFFELILQCEESGDISIERMRCFNHLFWAEKWTDRAFYVAVCFEDGVDVSIQVIKAYTAVNLNRASEFVNKAIDLLLTNLEDSSFRAFELSFLCRLYEVRDQYTKLIKLYRRPAYLL